MSRKQQLYLEVLEMILPFVRNIQRHSTWRRLRNGTFYPEMELVHNMHRILLCPDYTQHDIHWLNTQARIFIERGNNPIHGFYEPLTACIAELFTLVPESMRNQLSWAGPFAKVDDVLSEGNSD